MKLNIEYASFFNRNGISFVNNKIIDKCNNSIYQRSGIYTIVNKINNDRYIGQSKNVKTRLWQHKSLLRNNRHTYRTGELSLLQKAWNKYGEDAFEFKIVEFCDIDKLNDREQYWIDFYKCNHAKYRKGYNATDGGEGAYSNQNVKGRIHVHNGDVHKMIYPYELEEYERQGFIKGLPQEIVDKSNQNREIKYGNEHWAFGKNLSDEHKMKISEANKGRTSWIKGKHWDDEHKELLRIRSTGKKHSEDAKKKITESKQKPIVQYNKNNEKIAEYASGIDAENKTGISRSHISQCCNRKRKSAGGYLWRFKGEQLESL